MATIAPYVFWQELDNDGNPLEGGLVYTYEAGTSTPKATYTDSSGDTANANPIVLDSAGRAAVWLGDGGYKFVIKNAAGTTIATRDNIGGLSSTAFASNVYSISANTTITNVYANKAIVATETITLTLLAAEEAGDGFYFIVRNDGDGTITLDPDADELINGEATYDLVSGQSILVVCDGTQWVTFFEKPPLASQAEAEAGTENTKIMTPLRTAQAIAVFSIPSGVILDYAGTTAPTGYLMCYGQAISRTTYATLFTAISTTYGSGDGTTTFNVPDCRGRVIAGKDDMGGSSANRLTDQDGGLNGDTLGDTGGAETHALTSTQNASHTHTQTVGEAASGTANWWPLGENGDSIVSHTGVATGSSGSGTAHNNVQPTIILNKIIKT